jgi:hypothetical protein
MHDNVLLPTNRVVLWWPERGGTTRSHSEPGSETPQRRWYWDDRSCESRSPPGICPASSKEGAGLFFVRVQRPRREVDTRGIGCEQRIIVESQRALRTDGCRLPHVSSGTDPARPSGKGRRSRGRVISDSRQNGFDRPRSVRTTLLALPSRRSLLLRSLPVMGAATNRLSALGRSGCWTFQAG